ncbi:exodeoxyribonuclease VII large subunit [Undibacterium parvum]|uniref:Exodeoxyribonuclease 7 large subunit n=1 Tax=Undibacterium parvum TaxID=401471 RepID=A0A3S9HMY1_9BURK|nr:exodeoxyribonuclease VII large subunit [Undibacterium parvum]AZP13439.1 exodeoxyribonuclease VII large subunit [Undibacterium parvum]
MNPESPTSNPLANNAVITVSALNQAVAQLLERNFPLSWISGEISNFTRAASGHWYFSLKDSAAQVKAVMFRGRAQYADFIPREGDKVEVRALVSLYAPRGDYQINVEAIRRAGVGNLYEAFLQLKAKLASEGLFDTANKRAIPTFVRCVGIVTSLQAAALRDVLAALKRRAPHVQVILYPSPVQGEGAAEKIAQAIATASAREECDVLLVCRGGGSIEDLWSFNAEIVARTIAHCSMPVISGVGHETDFTIADFAADLRAATPTAAAELAAGARSDFLAELRLNQISLQRAMQRSLATQAQTLDWTARRLLSPGAAIASKRLQLQNCAQRLRYASHMPLQQAQTVLGQWRARLSAQRPDSATANLHLQALQRRLTDASLRRVQQQQSTLAHLQAQLELLNPQRTLERGYVILSDHKGKLIRSSAEIKPNSLLHLRTAIDHAELGISSVQRTLAIMGDQS